MRCGALCLLLILGMGFLVGVISQFLRLAPCLFAAVWVMLDALVIFLLTRDVFGYGVSGCVLAVAC